MVFALSIIIPFLMAVGVMFIRRYLRSAHQGWLIAGLMLALFLLLLAQLPQITEQTSLSLTLPWMPQIGLELSLYIDGLSMLFGLLILGLSVAVIFYAGYYFDDARTSGRFFGLLLAFTGSMLALVMAGNVLTLFIAWEMTSIISFLLIGFKGSDNEARAGASQALMITGGGGLALLVGLLLIGNATGSMAFANILSSGELLREHPWYSALTVLLLIGCFSKSAQFPLHFWLPGAMSAPTPASAFLHSATMVKAGIYLMARFYPVLGDTPLWTAVLPFFGLLTMLMGALIALRQRDLKGILAYTTISQLGAFTALIGLPDSVGLKAAMVGILAHALYKGAFFLIAGTVDHATGTRNIDELGGLRHRMPGLMIAALVASLSMAGVPPLLGFVGKETLLEAVIDRPIELVVVVVSAALTVTMALRLVWDVFWGKSGIALRQEEHIDPNEHHPSGDDAHHYSHQHHIPGLMVASPAVLGLLSVVAGVGVTALIKPLVEPAVGKSISLYLFPPGGINLAFTLSMIALAVGVGLFAVRRYWLSWTVPNPVTGAIIYQATIRMVERVGDLLLRTQGGRIRYYLVVILLTVALLLSTVISGEIGSLRNLTFHFNGTTDILKGFLLVITLVTTLASILFKRHLLAALSLALTGYAVGGLFLLEPAPDVALVQFLIETLATVLILMILARTSEEERQQVIDRFWEQTRTGLGRDVVISTLIGVLVGIFALSAVSSRPTPDPISTWYLQNALPSAGVNDVVAGIITDFRGTDTLVEIAVFGIAALGVLTMLTRPDPGRRMLPLFRRRPQGEDAPVLVQNSQDDREEANGDSSSHFSNPITRLAATIIFPLALLIAVSHIFYAGVTPGDGFTAGVIAGLGIALWFIVLGYEEARTRLYWLHPAPLIGIGLVIAILNASLPLLFGRDFFTLTKLSGFTLAEIKLASSVVFEIGIFIAVFGGISGIMEAITHPREVEPL